METVVPPREVEVRTRSDIYLVRQAVEQAAHEAGFVSSDDLDLLALVATELASNLVRYADFGSISASAFAEGERRGIEIVSQDSGPGISDLAAALAEGVSTGKGLGEGLPAVRRLMDDFSLSSSEAGTRVVIRKWISG